MAMKKIYYTPKVTVESIDTHQLCVISGGDSRNAVGISSSRDESGEDNRVKSSNYNIWEDDWNE
jgi:hypothetical protein